jgi:hypothetical protein
MHPEQRLVKFTTVLLPFLCFAVERRVKNKFCLLLTEKDTSLKFLFRKENVPLVFFTLHLIYGWRQTTQLASSPAILFRSLHQRPRSFS